jgi:hypothetical protein
VQSEPNDVDAIRLQMVQIRREHYEDVREVIADAERVVGWGRSGWPYVCAALGATAATVLWILASRDRTAPAGQASSSSSAVTEVG